MTPTSEQIAALLQAVADCVIAHTQELTDLDRAIGDGDHGLNMKRGFEAVLAEGDAIAAKPLGEALKAAGMQLVMKVGGASGPLYGTLLMAMGKQLPVGEIDRAALNAAFAAAVDAVMARGKSQPGQKTMLDVLAPVRDAMTAGRDDLAVVADAAAAATAPMQAVRGRASFLGERSIGHIDPGARSSALMVGAVMGVVEGWA